MTATGSCGEGSRDTATECARLAGGTARLTRSLDGGGHVARRTDPSAATVKVVRERDQWVCARCGGVGGLTTQHRVARGMGGTKAAWINQPGNLITLCGSGTTGCHGWVEANPTEARELGLSVSRNGLRPDCVPVTTWRGVLLLTNDGLALPVEPPPF